MYMWYMAQPVGWPFPCKTVKKFLLTPVISTTHGHGHLHGDCVHVRYIASLFPLSIILSYSTEVAAHDFHNNYFRGDNLCGGGEGLATLMILWQVHVN